MFFLYECTRESLNTGRLPNCTTAMEDEGLCPYRQQIWPLSPAHLGLLWGIGHSLCTLEFYVHWCFSEVSQEQTQSSTQIIKARCGVQSTTPWTEPSESCLRGDIIEPRTIPQGTWLADWHALCVKLRSFPTLTRGKREGKNTYWLDTDAVGVWSRKTVRKDKTQGQRVETTKMTEE